MEIGNQCEQGTQTPNVRMKMLQKLNKKDIYKLIAKNFLAQKQIILVQKKADYRNLKRKHYICKNRVDNNNRKSKWWGRMYFFMRNSKFLEIHLDA